MMQEKPSQIPERGKWVFYLTACEPSELIEIAQRLSAGWELNTLCMPRDGLGMLKIRDSALAEAFYLGEFPLARSWIDIRLPDGRAAQGAAQVLDDNMELAEALAVFDGILSNLLPGWEEVADLVHRGMRIRHKTNRLRKKILQQTRVDFSLLDAIGGDDED